MYTIANVLFDPSQFLNPPLLPGILGMLGELCPHFGVNVIFMFLHPRSVIWGHFIYMFMYT